MLTRIFIVTALLFTLNLRSGAQQGLPGKSLEEYLEYLAEIGFAEFETHDFSEEIASLEFRPVDINSLSEEEISRMFFLSSFQVKSLINYIRTSGPVKSVYELSYVPGFDKELAQLCSNYITLLDTGSGYGYNNTRIFTSFLYSDRDTCTYPGTDIKFSTRISRESGNISFGLTYEKDGGEKLFTDKYKPEFLAGSVKISFPSGNSSLLFGDYRVRFGQGLAIWHGYSPGVSPVNPNIIRGSSRIVPYLSTDENNYFRGLAFLTRKNRTGLNIYLSANKIDASTEPVSDSSVIVRSLYDGGLHNTELNLSKKDVLTEYSAGININHDFKLLSLGGSVTGTMFSEPIVPYERTENRMDFRGSSNIVFSADYALSLSRIYLYGEIGFTGRGKFAGIQGIKLIPAERVKLNMLWGYTGLGYSSFHGHIFGKETINNFRNSLLINIEADLAPGLKLYSGLVNHSDLWYGYRSAEFPQSTRYMTEMVWEPYNNVVLKISYKQREAKKDINVIQGIDKNDRGMYRSARMHLDMVPLNGIKLSSRFEISSSSTSGTKSYLMYQGVRTDMENIPLTLILRLYTYSIEDYDNRIYAWEDDLLYNPSVPAFYGKGNRNYLVVDYHPEGNIKIRFKYGITCYNRGKDKVMFNEYRLQLRLNLQGRRI